jgi:hypothetical protein
MTRRRWLMLAGAAVVVCALGGVKAFEVWTNAQVCACATPELEAWTIWNPFRAREPERVSQAYVRSLVNGECSKLPMTMFVSPEAQKSACTLRYSVKAWSLRSEETSSGGTTFGYAVGYEPGDAEANAVSSPLYVNVDRSGGGWRIAWVDTPFY